jgi:hypothetical protein
MNIERKNKTISTTNLSKMLKENYQFSQKDKKAFTLKALEAIKQGQLLLNIY